MQNASTSKIKDAILFILVVTSIGLSAFVFWKVNDIKTELIILNAKSNYQNHVKIECQKDSRDENCEQELKRAEKDLKDYIQTIK